MDVCLQGEEEWGMAGDIAQGGVRQCDMPGEPGCWADAGRFDDRNGDNEDNADNQHIAEQVNVS